MGGHVDLWSVRRNGREIRYRSEFGKGHLGKSGLDTEASSHDSESVEELHRQMVETPKV